MNGAVKALILGIGNELRRDDGIGPAVARALIAIGTVPAIDCATAPENFLGTIKKMKPDTVIMVDACDFGGAPGEFRLFRLEELDTMPSATVSTHTLPLSLIGTLIEREAGCRVELLGIQPVTVEFGEGLSDALERAKGRIVDFLQKVKPGKDTDTRANHEERKEKKPGKTRKRT